MLVRLLALSSFILASLSLGTPRSALETDLTKDALAAVLLKIGIAALQQTSWASKDFYMLARQVAKVLYGINYLEKTFVNYAKILHEHDRSVQSRGDERGKVDAHLAPRSS